MKKNLKRIFAIFLIICTILPGLLSTVVNADSDDVTLTSERAGNFAASFAINFYNNWSSENHIYEDESGNPVRTQYTSTYNIPNAGDSVYLLEKRSWIDFVYHNALSIDISQLPKNYYGTTSNKYDRIEVADLKEDILKIKEQNHDASRTSSDDEETEDVGQTIVELMNAGKIRPGDIIITTEEDYLLYVGGTRVIYATPPGDVHPTDTGALKYDYIQNYFVEVRRQLEKGHEDDPDFKAEYGAKEVYRISEEFAGQIEESKVNLMFNSRGYYDKENKYDGIPKGTYRGSERTTLIGSILEDLIGMAKFLVNLALYLVRAVVVGWVNIIESFFQSSLLKLSGHSSKVAFIDKITGVSNTSYAGERVTIESILFNKLPLTDANFFNFEEAGGYELVKDGKPVSWIYNIRKYLATLYVIMRNVSIAAMLFVLLYVGIRMAISTLAKKKAQYNKMLTAWFTGLCIVIFIHLFMYTTLFINDKIVDLLLQLNVTEATEILGETGESLSLYDAIRTKAYSWDFYDGLVGLIMYIFMVYFMIRYAFIYLKRMVSVYVLAIYGSIVGVRYAIEKTNGKRTSASFQRWMKDFMFNVLLQSIHCLIYVTLMGVAVKAALTSASGLILAIVICQFILKADKIFMKIFNVKGSLLDDTAKPTQVKGLLSNVWKGATAAAIGIGAFRFGTKFFSGNEGIRPLIRYVKAYRPGDSDSTIRKRADAAYMDKRAKRYTTLLTDLGYKGIPIPLLRRRNGERIHILHSKKNRELAARRRDLYSRVTGVKNYEIKKALFDAAKSDGKQRLQRFKRTISTVGTSVIGNVAGIASIGLYAEDLAAGAVAQAGLIKKFKGSSNKDIKIRRRLEPEKNYSYGIYGQTQIQNEKTEKDIKKLKDKEAALIKIADLQAELEAKLDEYKAIEGIDKENSHKKLQNAITATKRSTIKSGDVKGAISDYIHERLGGNRLSESDIDGIIQALQARLDNKESDIVLDDTLVRRLRDAIRNSGDTIDNIEAKNFAKILTEALDQPGVVPYIAGKRVESASSERVLDKLAAKVIRQYENNTGVDLTDDQKRDIKHRMRQMSNIDNMSEADIVDKAVDLMEGSFANQERFREATTEALSRGVPKLGNSDFEKIMDSIQSKIRNKQIDIGLTHKATPETLELTDLGNKVKERIIEKQRERIEASGMSDAQKASAIAELDSGNIIEEASNSDMTKMIYETLSEPGMIPAVTIKDDPTASAEQIQRNRDAERLLEESSQLLKKITSINQGNAAKNKESAMSYGKYIREILDNK